MSKLIAFIAQGCLLVAMSACLLYACDAGLAKQAEIDYKQCLSWQADGHPVQCKNPISKE